jgi:hypothetical protein
MSSERSSPEEEPTYTKDEAVQLLKVLYKVKTYDEIDNDEGFDVREGNARLDEEPEQEEKSDSNSSPSPSSK